MPGRYTTVVADYGPIINDFFDISPSICDFAVLGTRYIRDEPAPIEFELFAGESSTLTIAHIYSELPIGNTLDIKMRQSAGQELAFVSIIELAGASEISLKAT